MDTNNSWGGFDSFFLHFSLNTKGKNIYVYICGTKSRVIKKAAYFSFKLCHICEENLFFNVEHQELWGPLGVQLVLAWPTQPQRCLPAAMCGHMLL